MQSAEESISTDEGGIPTAADIEEVSKHATNEEDKEADEKGGRCERDNEEVHVEPHQIIQCNMSQARIDGVPLTEEEDLEERLKESEDEGGDSEND